MYINKKKILWIVNNIFPSIEEILSGTGKHCGDGGWFMTLASDLSLNDNISLYVAALSKRVNKLTKIQDNNGIIHFIIPYGKGNIEYNSEYESYWIKIQEELHPDIVHIHGTEFSHGLAYLNVCGSENVVVSIQGVMTQVANHFFGGLLFKEIVQNISIHDILNFKTSLFGLKKQYELRAKSEPQIFSKVKNVIGRTTFDKANALAFNPKLKYFHCDEPLREPFYSDFWCYKKCNKYTIFLSQAFYPLKGLHNVLKAISYIFSDFPDIQIRIAGPNIIQYKTFKDKINISGYGKLLNSLIEKYKLNNHITFTGKLSAEGIKRELLSANIFICSSSNENSSNSLAEAQILGVPCIASAVGGMFTMVPNRDCGILYPYDDIEQLALIIKEVFDNSNNFDNRNMRSFALSMHERNKIVSRTIDIYNQIIN